MLKTTSITKILEEKLKSIGVEKDQDYSFKLYTETGKVNNGGLCIKGSVRRVNASHPATAGIKENMYTYMLDLIVPTWSGENQHVVFVNDVLDTLISDLNGTYADIDEGRAKILIDGGVVQSGIEKKGIIGDAVILSVNVNVEWQPHVKESTEELKENEIEILLIKRTPYHNRTIDMNEEDDVVFRHTSTIIGWQHDEVSAVLKMKLPAIFDAEYNYVQVTEYNGRVTRWFVMQRDFVEPSVYVHQLKRDVIRENFDDIVYNSQALIKTGYVQETDKAIYNKEGGNFDKILINRDIITAPKWMACYLTLDTDEAIGKISALVKSEEEPIEINSEKVPEKLRVHEDYNLMFGIVSTAIHNQPPPPVIAYWDASSNRSVTFSNETMKSLSVIFSYFKFTNIPHEVRSNADAVARSLASHEKIINFFQNKEETKEILINGDKNLYIGKSYYVKTSDGKTWRTTIENSSKKEDNDVFSELEDEIKNSTVWGEDYVIGGWSGNNPSSRINLDYKEYTLNTQEVFQAEEQINCTILELATNYCKGETGWNIIVGDYNNDNVKAIMASLAKKASEQCIDLQIVPVDFEVDILLDNNVMKITKNTNTENEQEVGELYILTENYYTKTITVPINTSMPLKRDILFNSTKLVCPNNSGEIEYNARHLTAGNSYNIKINISLKPFMPYYSMTPIADGTGLYEKGEVIPLRLVFGGDFSETIINNKYIDYMQNNKYSQEIFNKQLSANEFVNEQFNKQADYQKNQMKAQQTANWLGMGANVALGVATGGLGLALAGSAAISGGQSAFSNAQQNKMLEFNKQQTNESFAYNQNLQTDLYNLNIATIKAQPNTVRKVSSGNYDHVYCAFIEQYVGNYEQVAKYMEMLKYLGYTVNRVDNLINYINDEYRVTAQLITTPVNDTHIVNEINKELSTPLLLVAKVL